MLHSCTWVLLTPLERLALIRVFLLFHAVY